MSNILTKTVRKNDLLHLHFKARRQSGWRKVLNFSAFVFILFILVPTATSAQFLHRNGKMIVDGNNNEIILRGIGLGGWMLQEGYMLETNAFANAQHEIRAKIMDLIGPSNTDEFYERWLTNFCTKRDIDTLAAWGFNSVRLPMHYNLFTLPIEQEPVPGQQTWLTKGFALTDSLVKWCAANSMYVILDLHAAPGGQGRDAAISDYDASKPSLWESDANKAKTIALWKKIAERYKNEKWIGGYDLINETNWNFTAGANQNGCDETANAPLRKLFTDITAAVREVDANHLIFIEGNCWANNHRGLFPAWDNNMAISFHKYWSINDLGSIQGLINMRDQHNLPLWMGEAGENSNVWFTGAIQLLEQNKIGWAWWPLKKINSVVNPLTVTKNEGYNSLLNYWRNGGSKPTADFARNALMQLTEDIKIQNNVFRKDVIDAMFRQVNDKGTRPFSDHQIPGVIHLSDFDLGRMGHAYWDSDSATHHVSTGGSYTAWNNGWAYRNDAVDLETNADTDPAANGINIGWTVDKEWTQYTTMVDSSAAYAVTLRYAAAAKSTFRIKVDGVDRTSINELNVVSGWNNKVMNDIILEKGVHAIQLEFIKGGANVSFLKFELSKKIADVSFAAVSAETALDGRSVLIFLNKKADSESVSDFSQFLIKSNTELLNVSSINLLNERTLQLTVDENLNDGEAITLDYSGSTIEAEDGTPLQTITSMSVLNTIPHRLLIPGKIEAESFDENQGLQLENTTDVGGGQNIGYTNAGDYLSYRVRVDTDGEYNVELRVASAGQAGTLEVQQLDEDGTALNSSTVEIPVTGGWQSWRSIQAKMNFQAGSGWLRLRIVKPEFNLNWIKFTSVIISGMHEPSDDFFKIFPNPAEHSVKVETPSGFKASPDSQMILRSMTGHIVKKFEHVHLIDQTFSISDIPPGFYIIQLSSETRSWWSKLIRR